MDKKTKTNLHLFIAIIGIGREELYYMIRHSTSLGIIKTPVIVFEKLAEEPPALSELILERIPILPFPPEVLDKQLKFSHHDAPKMRHNISAIKNYGDKLRVKSKRLQNKRGRR